MAITVQRVFRNTIVMMVSTVLSMVLGYVFRLLIARNYSTETFGLFYATIGFFGLFGVFQSLGLDSALIKRIAEAVAKGDEKRIPGLVRTVFLFQTISVLLIGGVLFALAPLIASTVLHVPAAVTVVRLAALYFIVTPFCNIFLSILQGHQEMVSYSLWMLARFAVFVLFFMLLMPFAPGANAPMIAYAAGTFAIAFPLAYYVRKKFPGSFSLTGKSEPSEVRSLVTYGTSILAGTIAGTILGSTDTTMIAYLSSVKEVALYSASAPLIQAVGALAGVMNIIFLPLSSEMHARSAEKSLAQGLATVQVYLVALLLPFLLLIIAFPGIFLNALFGPEYIPGSAILRVLALSGLFASFAAILSTVLNGIGHPQKSLKIVVAMMLLNIVINALLIPSMGALGAAIATLIVSIGLYGLSTRILKRLIPYSFPWRRFAGIVFGAAVFVATFMIIKPLISFSPVVEFLLIAIPATALYAAVIFATRTFTREDVQFVSGLVKETVKT